MDRTPRLGAAGRLLVPFLSTLVLLMAASPAGASPPQGNRLEHRSEGSFFDVCGVTNAQGGWEQFAPGDGGRIAHRVDNGTWSFQTVPEEVKDLLHRAWFLPPDENGNLEGWCVGRAGWILHTTNGGSTWSVLSRLREDTNGQTPGTGPYADLYDIHALNPAEIWVLGTQFLWKSTNFGAEWIKVPVAHFYGVYEYYAIDIIERQDGTRMGLLTGEPGLVFKATDANLSSWSLVLDVPELCRQGQLSVPSCFGVNYCVTDAQDPVGLLPYEPWDLEIRRGDAPGQELVLLGGGFGPQCGLTMLSNAGGDLSTWVRMPHECESGNCPTAGTPSYHCPPGGAPDTYKRHCHVKTIYGVAILDGDGTALAVGYNGQILLKPANQSGWVDRSEFIKLLNDPGAVVFPLLGVDADEGSATSGKAAIVGEGGFLLQPNGPPAAPLDHWVQPGTVGSAWRTRGVFFKDQQNGWRVGQLGRISVTGDAGLTWNPQAPQPAVVKPELHAVAFETPFYQNGVAVGDPDGANPTLSIWYTQDGGTTPWQPAVVNATISGSLRDVAWDGIQTFWAVGKEGMLLQGTSHGQTWVDFSIPSGYDYSRSAFFIRGVAFSGPTKGLFVGERPYPNGASPVRGVAYWHDRQATGLQWHDLTPQQFPSGEEPVRITDVAFDGDVGWAVGERYVASVLQGVVLRSSSISGGQPFEDFGQSSFPLCTAGDGADGAPVLTAVAVAPNGDVWLGGMCGRAWRKTAAGTTFEEFQSQTSAHIVNISFTPDGYGYFGCFRQGIENQSVVRFKP